ncbi:MAG: ABC transporter transmembrane domain-containing protein, partial [Phycisphaerae bacterium]|nr:ABC transporter transmembrane domain-containing protein [Phycisphaerae bacterium]
MNRFWHFAAKMLRYKRLLILGAAGALFDALCAFSGFSALMSIIDQMFNHQVPMQELIREKLADERVASILGDVTWIAEWIPAEPVWGFATVMGFILCLTFLGASGRFVHQYCMFTVSLRTVTLIRKQAFQHLVHLPMAVVAQEGTADHLSRVVRDCNQLSRGFHALMAKAARDLLQGMAMLSLAFLLDWKLSAVFLIGVPLIVVCVRKFGKIVRRAAHRVLGEYGHMVRTIQESLQAMRVVKVNQAEGYERRRFNTVNRRVLSQEMTARTARALSSPVIEIIAVIAGMVVCVM